jgi:hypothetical protein
MATRDDDEAPKPSTPKPLNRLNLESLRISQDFAENLGATKLFTSCPVRKPRNQDWVRVCPDPAYQLVGTALLELKEDREQYLVMPDMTPDLLGEWSPYSLFLAINRQNTLFIWPARLPAVDGKDMEWFRSGREAAERAMTRWMRLVAKMDLGAYEMLEASAAFGEPTWPTMPFEDILAVAFRDRIIDRPDHPVVKRIRGEA